MIRPPDYEVDAELRRRWALQLAKDWRWYNWAYLRDALQEPVFAISSRTSSKLGHWDRETRTIAIAEPHILRDSWAGVRETLRHEMAHQLVDEGMAGPDEPPHGPAFRRACDKLRISPRATGTGEPTDEDPAAAERERILARVDKLFALGQSPNQHEAELALQKARELLLTHNLSELGQRPDFVSRLVGTPRRRRHHYEQLLAMVLRSYFFVEVIWIDTFLPHAGHTAHVLEVHGTPANCELADYVHHYITSLLNSLWEQHKQSAGIRKNRDRLRFFAGVVSGFAKSLQRQEKQLEKQALVWTGDPRLRKHVRWHYPSQRAAGYGRGGHSDAYDAGVQAGKNVRLRRPLRGGRGDGGFGGYLGEG